MAVPPTVFRALYRQLLRHCAAADAAPLRKALLMLPSRELWDAPRSRWVPAAAAVGKGTSSAAAAAATVAACPAAESFRAALVGAGCFYRPQLPAASASGAAAGSAASAVAELRTHFRAAVGAAQGALPQAGAKELQAGFAVLRWLSDAAACADEIAAAAPAQRPPRRHTPLFRPAEDAAAARMLLSHPIAHWGQAALRHSIVLLDSGAGTAGEGWLLNSPLPFHVRDLLTGNAPRTAVRSTDPYLHTFSDCRVFCGGYQREPGAVTLTVLHPHGGDVLGARKVAPGLWSGGELRSMRDICEDHTHPAAPHHFTFLWGSLPWRPGQLMGELRLGHWQPLAAADAADPGADAALAFSMLAEHALPPLKDAADQRQYMFQSWQRAAADLCPAFADSWCRLPGPPATKATAEGGSGAAPGAAAPAAAQRPAGGAVAESPAERAVSRYLQKACV
eukprot:TRINITY_DN66444_c0_g1_i1.p1 TRINITY_DN66444_c0_g1~~TRINITY_DN66444_c0_g1_i1.p1  ORF type:complete len:477 (+),score=145.35 TRINITY_DN66444_c0_g1_i1:83-1432(+)